MTIFRLFLLLAAVVLSSNLRADTLVSTHGPFIWTHASTGGQIQVTLRVFKDVPEIPGLYKWEYEVANLSFNPAGIGLNGFAVQPHVDVPEKDNFFSPSNLWKFDNAQWNSPAARVVWVRSPLLGQGLLPGETGRFGFTTSPREGVVVPPLVTLDGRGNHGFSFRESRIVCCRIDGDQAVPGPLSCQSGRKFLGVPLPEVSIPLPIAKYEELSFRFAPLEVDFTVQEPTETGALCSARSESGSLQVFIVNVKRGISYDFARSTATATITLFGGDSPYVVWHTAGFVITGTPFTPVPMETGPITTPPIPLSHMGLTASTPFETIVRTAESFIHVNLSHKIFDNLTKVVVWEDPGATDLLVTDPNGRQTGILANGAMIADVPFSAYFPSIPLLLIAAPANGEYRTTVRARLPGEFLLAVRYGGLSNTYFGQTFSGNLNAKETATYLTVVSPSLSISREKNAATIAWTLPADGFVLEANDGSSVNFWSPVAGVSSNSVSVPLNKVSSVYRLRRE